MPCGQGKYAVWRGQLLIHQEWRAVALTGRTWAASAGLAAGTLSGCLTVTGVT
jgi:hypothetical protein